VKVLNKNETELRIFQAMRIKLFLSTVKFSMVTPKI
jgi:hypothetical protein